MTNAPACLAILLALAPAACKRPAPQSSDSKRPEPPMGEAWLSDQQIKEAKIEVTTIAEENVDDTIITSGRVTFDDLRVAHVFSPVTGRVARIDAALGQHVKKGDSLCVLDSPDIGIASSDTAKALADVIAADHDLKRKKVLFEKHAGSAADVEVSEDNYRRSLAELERAKQKAYLLRQGGVDSVSQRYTMSASIDGEIIARQVFIGEEIQGQYSGGATLEMFTIGQLDKLWVMADVFEQDFPRVKIGGGATVRSVSYPERPVEGKIDWVTGTMDPVTRSAKVRIVVDNADRSLRPEMFTTVTLHVDQRSVPAVPRSSLVRLGDATYVFLETGKTEDGRTKFERVPVMLDEGENENWLPLTGPSVPSILKKGARVVVVGAVLLSGNTPA